MNFLMPKAPAFNSCFQQMTDCLNQATAIFQKFIREFKHFEDYWEKIKEVEHKADDITHEVINLLNQSFITPFDREDIYHLIHEMDDIIDLQENVIHNIMLYEITEKNPLIDHFSDIIGQASEELTQLIANTFNHQKYNNEVKVLIRRIHELEDEGDSLFEDNIRRLFKEEKDPIVVIKWKDILQTLEYIMDVYQKVSNTVEGIVVKNS